MIYTVGDLSEETLAPTEKGNNDCFIVENNDRKYLYRFIDGELKEVKFVRGRKVKGINEEHHFFRNIFEDPNIPIVNVFGPAGSGKCMGKGTKVVMFDGTMKPVEEIIPGDLLMGPDSKKRLVLSTTTGIGPLFEVAQNTGINYVVNEHHILALKKEKVPVYKNIDKKKTVIKWEPKTHTEIAVKDFLNLKKWEKRKLQGYKVPLEFETEKTPFHPYLIGTWLGDGTQQNTILTINDEEIRNEIADICKKENLQFQHVKGGEHNQNAYSITTGETRSHNPFRQYLKDSGLMSGKHIPDIYKYNSRENRLQLLAGMIDTDGTLGKNLQCEFYNTNKNLIDDFAFVARSLGFRVNVSEKISDCHINGRIYNKHKSYRASLTGDINLIPTKVKRKQARKRKMNKDPLVTGFEIKPIGEGEHYGFMLDGDGLFLLEDLTVTHNSFMSLGCAIEAVYQGEFSKVIVVRELVPSTQYPMGFLPGDADEKINPMFGAIFDTIDALIKHSKLFNFDTAIDATHKLLTSGTVEFTTMETLRGRNLEDAIIIADDAQNLDIDAVRLLITRVAGKSKIIFNGDISQIDNRKMKSEPGIVYLDKIMKGAREYASLEFTHSECRSELVKLFLDREKEYLAS